jgi:hypothetical protein
MTPVDCADPDAAVSAARMSLSSAPDDVNPATASRRTTERGKFSLIEER